MTGDHEWEAIERSPEFRALVSSRRRWVAIAGGGTVGLCVAYVLIAYLAPDVLGEALGWIAGVGLIVLTGVVSLLYLRKSDRDWSPAEEAITARRTGRFERVETPDRERVS
jgi:uncharacterized membrane protein (DUF485 family)